MEERKEMTWSIVDKTDGMQEVCFEVFDPDERFVNADDAEGQAWEKVVEMGGLRRGEHFTLYCNGDNTLALTSILKVCMREGINITLMHQGEDGAWFAQDFDMEALGKAARDNSMLWEDF